MTVSTSEPKPESPTAPEALAVRDAESANWLVRRIVETRHYADHVRGWAAMEIRRAEREKQFFLQRYGGQLEDWAHAELTTREDDAARSVCRQARLASAAALRIC